MTEPEDDKPYQLRTTPTVRRAFGERPPEAVAAAAYEFITGSLLWEPFRVGKQLLPPLDDRFSARRGGYRVIYRIDEECHSVTVVDIDHRRDVPSDVITGLWLTVRHWLSDYRVWKALLLCKYEHPLYQQFQASAPAVGERVTTPDGPGRVVGHSVPRDTVTVRLDADGSRCSAVWAAGGSGTGRRHRRRP